MLEENLWNPDLGWCEEYWECGMMIGRAMLGEYLWHLDRDRRKYWNVE
jgi:hypothetical protein